MHTMRKQNSVTECTVPIFCAHTRSTFISTICRGNYYNLKRAHNDKGGAFIVVLRSELTGSDQNPAYCASLW